MAEPVAKRARTEEEDAPMEEAKAEDEAEENFVADTSARIQEAVTFRARDTTMNVMASSFGSLLVPLMEGGLQHFLAGARASVGVKSGRYMFEARIVEVQSAAEEPQAKGKIVLPRQLLRLGFGIQGSSLLLDDSSEAAFFDSLGFFWVGKEKTKVSLPFGCGDTAAVLLNLDAVSSNCLTISLFINGKRACKPQGLPQQLVGKALFPCLTFKGVTVHHHFGPQPLQPLEFTCRMLQEAGVKDAVIQPAEAAQPQVVFPVALPDEGAFDWLDNYLRQHPHVTELSDRAILRWAEQSGIVRPKGYTHRTNNDKPDFGFGLPSVDDGSIRKALNAVVPLQRRDYVVMEVRSNLLKADRSEQLARWSGMGFKLVSVVAMGEPPKAIRDYSHQIMQKEKQEKANAEFKKQLVEEMRKREAAKKLRVIEKQRASMLKRQKKAAEKARRKLENDRKKKEAEAKGEEFVEEPEPAEEDDDNEGEDKEEAEEQPLNETPPKVDLTAEEKAVVFRKSETPDLTSLALSTSFMKFELPAKEEGFDDVVFEWSALEKCRTYLRSWVQAKKATTRIEDLKPGDWFTEKQKEWNKVLLSWHTKYGSFRQTAVKRATEASAKRAAQAAAQRRASAGGKDAKASEEAAAAAAAAKEAADEGSKAAEAAEAEGGAAEAGDEEKADDTRFDSLDVYGVEDVLDVGTGEPLFAKFAFEDWVLMALRVELHLLAHAFSRDVDDPDRAAIHIDHLCFYYQKYFKKPLNVKLFGVETVQELLAFVRDAVAVARKTQTLEAQVPDNFESMNIFVMLQEEARRDRTRRIDLGDESARLKVQQDRSLAPAAPAGARNVAPANPKAAGGASWSQPKWQTW